MDYRNADGSVAEMCGNGIRVFGRYLLDHDLVAGPEFAVATRGGTRLVRAEPDGEITVDMGAPQVLGTGRAILAGQPLEGLRLSLGNPHLACLVDSPLAEFDLSQPPELDAGQFPDGVNLELVSVIGNGHILMRVYERGSGATRSCGTGAVAAAAAAAVAASAGGGAGAGSRGRCHVRRRRRIRGAPGRRRASRPGCGRRPSRRGGAVPPLRRRDRVRRRARSRRRRVLPRRRRVAVRVAGGRGPVAGGCCRVAAGGWVVDVPGGRLRVIFDGQTSLLSGPAVIVAEGELDQAWLSGRPAIPD